MTVLQFSHIDQINGLPYSGLQFCYFSLPGSHSYRACIIYQPGKIFSICYLYLEFIGFISNQFSGQIFEAEHTGLGLSTFLKET